MKKARKALLTLCAALLLVSMTVGATVAYLTSTDEVKNTFTVGNVEITLDEAKVNTAGEPMADDEVVEEIADADRTDANNYKLLPGHTYVKDPTTTVKANSEDCYVRMKVTFNKSDVLDTLFPDADLTALFTGYDNTIWKYENNVEDEENHTRTYEFRYHEIVAQSDADNRLAPLFTHIVMPGTLNNAQLAQLAGVEITVVAEAIQADGFADVAAAWAAWQN